MAVTRLWPIATPGHNYGTFTDSALATPIPDLVIPQVPLEHGDEVAHRRQIATVLNALLVRTGVQGGFPIGENLASADPLIIGEDGIYFQVAGTTNFAGITVTAGRMFFLRFSDVLTITHSSSLDLPGAADITTAAGDIATCFSILDNTVRFLNYQRAADAP